MSKIENIRSISYSPTGLTTSGGSDGSGLLIIKYNNGKIEKYQNVQRGYYLYIKETWINGSFRRLNDLIKFDIKKQPIAIRRIE